ncbi:group III truncated hemoglobin [Hymenobacter coalescens]
MKTAPASALTDIVREADVKTLVDNFCEKVNQDEVLGPAFNATARLHWPQHLFTLYSYWSTTLLGSVQEKAQALPKNLGLPTEGPRCQRWLTLFNAAVRETFAGPKADEVAGRVLSLAARLER